MAEPWNKISEESQHFGFREIVQKTYLMPDGEQKSWTTIGRMGGKSAGVIALTTDNMVVIARQFRPGPESVLDELPGGRVDDGEDPVVGAARELLEETGYTTNDPLVELGTVCRSAYQNEIGHYYLARNCRKVTEELHLDDGEFIDPVEITIGQLIENAKTGKMSDAAAVLMAYDTLKELQENQHA